MAQRARKLGRGLDALLGTEGAQAIAALRTSGGDTSQHQHAPLHWLTPGRFQPRRHFDEEGLNTLAASIKSHGVLQPLLVRPLSSSPSNKNTQARYEIIAGERRWRAAQKADTHEVPIIITELDDERALQVGLIENLQRQDLNPLEEANAYQRLMQDFGHTQKEVGIAVGRSRSYISNSLRLLTLPKTVLQAIETGHLSPAHARLLVGSEDAEILAVQFIEDKLNVRDAEILVQASKSTGIPINKTKKTPSTKDNDTLALEKELTRLLGLRVAIDHKEHGGALRIVYKTMSQLDAIIERLKGT